MYIFDPHRKVLSSKTFHLDWLPWGTKYMCRSLNEECPQIGWVFETLVPSGGTVCEA